MLKAVHSSEFKHKSLGKSDVAEGESLRARLELVIREEKEQVVAFGDRANMEIPYNRNLASVVPVKFRLDLRSKA